MTKDEAREYYRLQAEGLRAAYVQDLLKLNTTEALENIRGLLELSAKEPLRESSGLVEMQRIFRTGSSRTERDSRNSRA